MSELTTEIAVYLTLRRRFLAGVSAMALAGYGSAANLANAADAAKPVLWIELDGQYSNISTSDPRLAPSFLSPSPFDGISHLSSEDGPRTAWDKAADITLRPDGDDWFLRVGARYGKSSRSGTRDSHPTTANLTKYSGNHYSAYQNLTSKSSKSYVIADFQVGKDVGLGRFGSDGSSSLSAGIRIAQFRARSHTTIKSQPTNQATGYTANKFYASFDAAEKFNGIGPAISWDASAMLLGRPSGGSITIDWGINGALLFGRQKSEASHSTSQNYWHHFHRYPVYQTSNAAARSRTVTVPNIGGFAAVSWRYPNAKISFGYRADMFFNAMDTGLDARRATGLGFHGPYAALSIGLGGN